ncbi:MAG: HAD family hydrolase [Lachnospiraceae bacterium]|nr:HAD family hydrolase [Lachnospiraceae bacterium]
MSKKLIFFDIDGTLVKEGELSVTKSSIEAIKKARENGHQCFINTGRPIASVGKNITTLPFDGYICGCGTYIQYQGKEILHKELDEKLVKEIIKWSEEKKFDIFFEGKYGLLFPPKLQHKDGNQLKEYFGSQGVPIAEYNYKETSSYHTDKFTAWYVYEEDADELRSMIEEKLEIIDRGYHFWEVIPKGYSKSTGIEELLKYLGMNVEDTISIGDSANDIPMLQYTKESVLMGNGDSSLKNMVTFVTKDLEEDGVAYALEHFNII